MTTHASTNSAAADPASAPAPDRTVRIEHDRRRLLMRVLASIAALLATCAALVFALLHANEPAFDITGVPQLERLLRPHATASPWWTCTLLAFAVVGALIGTLRNVFRLQDGDPALVISPHGISFRPAVFAEIVRIPWTAIRGLRLRQRKHNRFLAVQVDEPDRFAAQSRIFAPLPISLRLGARANEIDFTTPMSKHAWTETEALLRRYLACYGRALPAEHARAAPPPGRKSALRATGSRTSD